MKVSIQTLIILLSLCLCFEVFADQKGAASGRITVKVTGLRSNSGEVRVHLYNSRDGFPSNPQKAIATMVSTIKNAEADLFFTDIPFGDYAISVLHDENGNKKMDLNWLMIPKEGIGASNNPRLTFGPPSFNDAKFRLDSEELTVKIKVSY